MGSCYKTHVNDIFNGKALQSLYCHKFAANLSTVVENENLKWIEIFINSVQESKISLQNPNLIMNFCNKKIGLHFRARKILSQPSICTHCVSHERPTRGELFTHVHFLDIV